MPRLRVAHAADDREDLAVVGALLERVHDLLVRDLARPRGSAPSARRRLRRPRPSASRGTPAARSAWSSGIGISLQPPRSAESWRKAFMSTRSITPSSSCSEPIGISVATHVRAEGRLELLERAEEVGALAVEHVHEQHPRDVELGRARPQPARRDLDAHHGVDDEHRRLAHAQRAERVGDEARLARRVEQVDLALAATRASSASPRSTSGAPARRDRRRRPCCGRAPSRAG